jgi:hypothetical protein
MLENTELAIKNGQSRETDNIKLVYWYIIKFRSLDFSHLTEWFRCDAKIGRSDIWLEI